MNEEELDSEKLNQFIEYLQGEYIPPNWDIQYDPKLSLKQAWNVIYMLQEWLLVIPDHFELCSICHQVFNIEHDGFYAGDDIEQVNDNIKAGFNISNEDVGKFFCYGCR